MKTFFSSTFIKEETLNEARIFYPIKLEYYKIINSIKEKEQENFKFGINIVKKEYKKEGLKVENKELQHITNSERIVEKILEKLKQNEVTPIAVEDVLSDLLN